MNKYTRVPSIEPIESTLEQLRRQGRVVRLKGRRNAWPVYVSSQFVNGRPVDDLATPTTLVDLAEGYSRRLTCDSSPAAVVRRP